MYRLYKYVAVVDSTNQWMKNKLSEGGLPEGFVVRAGFQEAGRGQGTNRWESERGRNLLFSVLLRPEHIPIASQFLLSQLISLAIVTTLHQLFPDEKNSFSVKWPNDIYWNDRKLGGILIENVLQGNRIKSCVIGVGLNINQMKFCSDAPNPVSLRQVSGRRHRVVNVMQGILYHLFEFYTCEPEFVRSEYARWLYRREGVHLFYSAGMGRFEAAIVRVDDDGRLVVKEKTGAESGFYFKEIQFLV
jgi:BirA family biotin operon repressor/biotin-[acetyl-CoA-carboxylase] ligase